MWGTPTVKGNYANPGTNWKGKTGKAGTGLAIQARMWGTPTARMWKGPGRRGELPTQLQEIGPKMSLNPAFVERLMGVPLGWTTGSECSETEWSRWLQRMRFALWYVERLNEGRHD